MAYRFGANHHKRQGGRQPVKGTDSKKSLYLCELHEREDQIDLCKFKKYFSCLILIITVAAN